MGAFLERLDGAALANRSLLCVGLDPDPSRMPVSDVAVFLREVIDATGDLVCAYKPNVAFFEALGMSGLRALERVMSAVPPHIPTIGDGKRGDVGASSRAYARAMFERWGFDAATVSPYLGWDSVEPFLAYGDRGVFVLCRTSNPGGADLQDLPVLAGAERHPLYRWVALRAREWDRRGNVGLVVGATRPRELAEVRELCPELPILVPGVGAQGGDLAAAVRLGTDARGRRAVVSASRSVIYASADPRNYPGTVREAARSLREAINRALEEQERGWP